MKVKVSELAGRALDWAVAKALFPDYLLTATCAIAAYSTDWSQGGPIIEREMVKVSPNLNETWTAQIRHTGDHPLVAHPVLKGWTNRVGSTPLIAAMRCFVASKLGDEVDVPEALCH